LELGFKKLFDTLERFNTIEKGIIWKLNFHPG
jgi:hypothetical protein